MAKVILSEDLDEFLSRDITSKSGCFVDTNLLFAADYDLHDFNTEAVEIGEALIKYQIPIFSNSVIRSELLELKRRVFITEGLMDYYNAYGGEVPERLQSKLASLYTKLRRNENTGRHSFLTDREIKVFRNLFKETLSGDAWLEFCKVFLRNKLSQEWSGPISAQGIIYVESTNSILEQPLKWSNLTVLMETYGIGCSDAMILNFFLASKCQLIVTADSDVAYCMSHLKTEKYCVVPSGLQY